MRIALIVTQAEGGGAQTAATRLAGELRRRGHSAETWFLYRKRATFDGAAHTRVLLESPPGSPLAIGRLIWRLAAGLRRFDPDAVVSFTHYANVIGLAVATACGIRVRVASQRNPAWTYPRLARWLDRWLGASFVYTANVAVSQAVADSFGEYPSAYRRKLEVVRNGVDRHSAGRNEDAADRTSIADGSGPIVLSVGRLAAQKNQATLIRAIADVPSAHLVLAGEGELRGELTSLSRSLGIASRVHLIGEVSRDGIRRLLRSADVFALPSLFEGQSNAVLEAVQAGLPIVLSDIPPQRELLCAHGGAPAGILLHPLDEHAWSETLGRLCGNAQEREVLASQARKLSPFFSIEVMADGFERVLRQDRRPPRTAAHRDGTGVRLDGPA